MDTTTPSLDGLSCRVESLEWENRWYRRGGALVLVLLVGLVAMGQASPDSVSKKIRAESVEIVDRDGKTRIALGSMADGTPLVTLLRDDQSRAVVLHVSKDGRPEYTCFDERGTARAMMGLFQNGASGLELADAEGKSRTIVRSAKDGAPSVWLFDESQVMRAALGTATIEARDSGAAVITSPASLTLYDKRGLLTYKVP